MVSAVKTPTMVKPAVPAGATTVTNAPTLGQFLFDHLKQEGITEIFGVPGDYNFTLLDKLERYQAITFVNNRNELNAGYSADAYARVKGIAALITTFGVGEMSACNAIAGANSEHIPIIHIVGAPPSMAKQQKKLMHHTLMDGDYDVFRKVYEPITVYTAWVTPENAAIEIPAAIKMAKEKKKPVYLVMNDDLVAKPITIRETLPAPAPMTNQAAMQAAITHANQLLDAAVGNTVLLVDVKAMRFQQQQAVTQFAEALDLPVAVTVLGKGAFDEHNPNFIGVYGGQFGEASVTQKVESAACVIAVGLLWSDTNAASFTAKLDPLKTIQIQPDMVKVGEADYSQVMAMDIMKALENARRRKRTQNQPASFTYKAPAGNANDPLKAASYYPRIQQMLRDNDTIVVETGTFLYGMAQVKLPRGVTYIAEGGWQAIGYATPAAFGACIAAPNRRVLLFTGDGSIQLTAQEISSMLSHGCKPILFVLNNSGYTIEKYLNVKTSNQAYNQIPAWSYTKLPEAFGGEAFTASVRTNGEMDEAIKRAETECMSKLCLIEMIVTDPLDAPDYMLKMRSYMEEQEKKGLIQ